MNTCRRSNCADRSGKAEPGATAIDAQDLTVIYGARRALDGLTFTTSRGRFTALLGPNGAGKSTLFAVLTNLILPGRGKIEVLGVNLLEKPRCALAGMGVVFQQSTLDLEVSVDRNLSYFAALHGYSGRTAAVSIDRALELLDMRERRAERVRDLNGGHRRRAEIARAMVHDPALLLLDEPTVGLDAAARRSITDHVHALCTEHGLAVLWATHLVDEVREDDDLLILHRGTLIAQGRAHEIADGASLAERFLAKTAGPE